MHQYTVAHRIWKSASVTIFLSATFILTGCGGASPTPAEFPEAIATTRQVMLGITKPASDVVFQVAAKDPASASDWEQVEASAQALAESGILLTRGLRAVNQPEWRQHVKDLIERAGEAAAAARAKNVEETLSAGNRIYEVCDNCHKKFMPARQNEAAADSGTPGP